MTSTFGYGTSISDANSDIPYRVGSSLVQQATEKPDAYGVYDMESERKVKGKHRVYLTNLDMNLPGDSREKQNHSVANSSRQHATIRLPTHGGTRFARYR
jgi:hypothetical protein